MVGDAISDCGLTASISVCTESAEAHSNLSHTILQQVVQEARIAAQDCYDYPLVSGFVLSVFKVVLLHPPESGTEIPVRRSSSARLTLSGENLPSCSAIICSMAFAMA